MGWCLCYWVDMFLFLIIPEIPSTVMVLFANLLSIVSGSPVTSAQICIQLVNSVMRKHQQTSLGFTFGLAKK